MALVVENEGVVRDIYAMDAGRSGVEHMVEGFIGVDGVVIQFLNLLDGLDHIEIDVDTVSVFTVDSSGITVSMDGSGLETLNQYGSVSVTSNQVQVTCTTRLKELRLGYTAYGVFKDGHRDQLYNLFRNMASVALEFSVTGYEYFNCTGWYVNYCFGDPVMSDYVTNSASKTLVITDPLSSYGELSSIMGSSSGTIRSRQTFNSAKINGTSIPIVAVNNLT